MLRRKAPVKLTPEVPEPDHYYRRLSLREVILSFAGYRRSDHPVHNAIAALTPGDRLVVRFEANRWELLDSHGIVVGQLSGNFEIADCMRCKFATVWAIVIWDRERSDLQYQDRLNCENWEVVVPELVFEPKS